MCKVYQHLAVALWMAAIMLMAFSSVETNAAAGRWALLLGLGASSITSGAIVTHSRAQVIGVIASEDEKVEGFATGVLKALDNPRGS